jgi:hypothetical protein
MLTMLLRLKDLRQRTVELIRLAKRLGMGGRERAGFERDAKP